MRQLSYIICLLLIGCNTPDSSPTTPNVLLAGAGKYLSSYTDQRIDIDESLQFRFSSYVVEAGLIGSSVGSDILKSNPHVPGKAYWKDGATLVFEPSELLDYDRDYTFHIAVDKIFPKVPTEFETISLSYHTSPLNLNIKLDDIQYGSFTNDRSLNVTGRVNSNNAIDNTKVEKMLTVAQKGNKKLVINWDHYGKKSRQFTIENIERQKKESVLNVIWDGSKYGSTQKGTHTINILPVGTFKVINAEIDETDKKTIIVSFSDQLDLSQNLTGLATIKDYPGKLKIDKAGSKLRINYSKKLPSPFTLVISENIRRKDGDQLKEGRNITLSIEPLKPTVKLIGDGIIIPDSDEIIFPFLASNLNSVTIEIYKIYQDNVLQYLQYGQLDQRGNRHTVGKVIHREKINLYDYTGNESVEERRIALNLKDFINTDPGAIYQVRVGFDQSDVSNYACANNGLETYRIQLEEEQSILDYYNHTNWNERENPCHPAYYQPSKFINRNILASNLGIIAKHGKDNVSTVTVTNLKTIEPLSGVKIAYYDYQKQLLASTTTDDIGLAQIELKKPSSFIIAQHSGSFGYLNLQERYANSLSEFEVSGKTKNKSLDGMIYGERGVWRPGDTLFLNFILEDANLSLPPDHPIKFELIDSRSNKKYSKITKSNLGHIYHFPVPTSSADPTGNWRATATVGSQKFTKTLKVETVKPNRLKIDFEIPQNNLTLYDKATLNLSSAWLHGAKADGLKAKVDLQLAGATTTFKNSSDYVFDDPARKIQSIPLNVFDGQLDEQGKAQFQIKSSDEWLPAGKLQANIKTRVYEKSGNFSEDNISVSADLYKSYVGINIPQTRWGSYFISNEGTDKIKFKTVDPQGQAIPNRKLSLGIYEARWSWWYDSGNRNKYNYNTALHNGAVVKDKINSDGQGMAEYVVDLEAEYGNYMIRICDEESGHCTGGMFYTGRNWSDQGEREGPQLLNFKTDKKEYELGETIKTKIPSNNNSKLFVSVENGSSVLSAFWVESTGDLTEIELPCTSEMSPNVYIHATLVQQHSKKENDLPLRMYGVAAIKVVDPATTLSPVIAVPSEVRPDEHFNLQISEENGQPMHYTVAVVDEGLLGLTRFKTPDAWAHFYAKQALGIKTWDLYDLVLSGYGAAMDKLISIGGDAANKNANKAAKANRFKPVVKHLGPFRLAAGQTAQHRIKIENYVGAVRTMVVARNLQQYGKVEKTTKVKKPLMIQATLPRVLGPGETLSIPANVFVMEDNIRKVEVGFSATGPIALDGPGNNQLEFNKQGDKLSDFKVTVGNEIGVSKVSLRAASGAESSRDEVEIEIRNPNPITTAVKEKVIQPNQSWAAELKYFGTKGTNNAVLEVSNTLPINLDKRLNYLIRYPYGCVEQTTSSVFPQLYLSEISDLSTKKIFKIEKNIQRGIERLSMFQVQNGSLSYWIGNFDTSDWGTSYAYHFLLEAKEKGYFIPSEMLTKLQSFISNHSNNYPQSQYQSYHHKNLNQAYRLYLLAKAGVPEIGAMNRLRNEKKLSNPSQHLLAAAYALIGKKEVARTLLASLSIEVKPYNETGYSYGSELRDQSIILEALTIMEAEDKALDLVNLISKQLNSWRWYSTQSTAFALLGVGKYIAAHPKGEINFEWNQGAQAAKQYTTAKPIATIELSEQKTIGNNVKLVNKSSGVLYTKLIVSGQKPPGTSDKASSKHITMDVKYKTLEGKVLDITQLKQGTDFLVEVDIKNLGTRGYDIEELVLNQIFPSGWEIQNQRMGGQGNLPKESNYEYRDIRDDRVNTFFDIKGKTSVKYLNILTATYAGRFYLPGTYVEAMYDNEIQAKSAGQWVEVSK